MSKVLYKLVGGINEEKWVIECDHNWYSVSSGRHCTHCGESENSVGGGGYAGKNFNNEERSFRVALLNELHSIQLALLENKK